MDALPMLHRADRVILVEASNEPVIAGEGINDSISWLQRHGIRADLVNSRINGTQAETVAAIAADVGADLIVAGAYGHGRVREWAFGGVTRDLLLHERRCTLLSH